MGLNGSFSSYVNTVHTMRDFTLNLNLDDVSTCIFPLHPHQVKRIKQTVKKKVFSILGL